MLGPLRLIDNVGGGLLGAVTGLALCWAVGAVLLYLPGQTELRRYAQDSVILSRLNQELPPTRLIDTLARIDPFAALAGPAADVAPPDPAVLDSAGVSAAALSVVRVVGTACGLGIEGSGWVAGPGLVVTNAHVVAGVWTPRVDRNDGDLLDARVVAFDKLNDIAVLRVAGLDCEAAPARRRRRGNAGRRFSATRATAPTRRPPSASGGSRRSSAATRTGASRRAGASTTIRGAIRSGNSGGPVVDAQGRVITTVFAQRAGTDGGYGVPDRDRARGDRAGGHEADRDALRSTAEVARP